MNEPSSSPPPDYGIDAPPVIGVLLLLSAGAFTAGAVLYVLGVAHPLGIPLFEIALVFGANCLANVLAMVWYSKAGKLRQRDRLLDLLPWRGDETVLDVGCGRGLMLIGAARRLTTGRAIGVDIWQSADLSGNRPEATLENARRAGVKERVEVKDGDARRLPFPDATFNVVVSSLALHNIPTRPDREQAVREIARVLKPGGHVALLDIQHTADYARVLQQSGLSDVRRSFPGPLFFVLFTLLTWGAIRYCRVTGRKAPPAGTAG
jgi:SAM-dependent methyltransferase